MKGSKLSVLTLVLLFCTLSGCKVTDSDTSDNSEIDAPFELKPNAACTNSTSEEWTHLGLNDESVLSILVHPQNPRVIFAGTGFDFSAQRDGKIFRSMDCGDTWENVYEGGHFRGLLLHPSEPYTLFAWDHNPTGALLRSKDGGTSWHLHSEGKQTDGSNRTSELFIHPENPRIMYAGTSGFGSGGLYKSINGGEKWSSITMNHWPHLASGAAAMFLHPDQPELLFHSADFNGTLSRSTDGGDSWSSLLHMDRAVRKFALNPYNPDQIVGMISRLGLLVSDDRGNEWRVKEISEDIELYYDVNFIDGYLYIATARGVLKTHDLINYNQVGSRVLGQTSEGEIIRFPRNVRAVVSDVEQTNLYIGHSLMLFDDETVGGVYVRKLDH